MIPKIIHYCWFGRNEIPKDAQKCIDSWRKFCPDYKIIQWDEDNYDVMKNQYMKDAYQEKKWAYVSDYARIDIIYQNGGIYMDLDVELIKSLDAFLNDGFFAGWENREYHDLGNTPYENSVNFGLGFGAEKGHPVLKDTLDLYEELSFYKEDGTLNLLACPHYQTVVLKEYGLDDTQRSYQRLENIVIYPETFFSPKSQLSGQIHLSSDTVSIHHFSMSSSAKGDVRFKKLEWKLSGVVGYPTAHRIVRGLSLPYRAIRKLKLLFFLKEKRREQ